MTAPLAAIALAVARAGGDVDDARDLAAAWERMERDWAPRVDRMRYEAAHPRCCCVDEPQLSADGRCSRCYGYPYDQPPPTERTQNMTDTTIPPLTDQDVTESAQRNGWEAVERFRLPGGMHRGWRGEMLGQTTLALLADPDYITDLALRQIALMRHLALFESRCPVCDATPRSPAPPRVCPLSVMSSRCSSRRSFGS